MIAIWSCTGTFSCLSASSSSTSRVELLLSLSVVSSPVQVVVVMSGLSWVGTGSGVMLVIVIPLWVMPTGPICTLPVTTMMPAFSLMTILASVWISDGSIGIVIN